MSNNIICEKCLKMVAREIKLKQYDVKDKYYNKHLYFSRYRGKIKKIILEYKFKDKAFLYKFFAEIIKLNEKQCCFLKKYDIIIPVPIHFYRKIKRGYNQSELIVKELEKTENIKVESSVLIRARNLMPQSKLNRQQRLINIKNAYRIKNTEKIYNKKCLIFDDIYTTGSTVNECAKMLMQAGAKSVDVLTMTKA